MEEIYEILKNTLDITNENLVKKMIEISEVVNFSKDEMILGIGEKQENVYLLMNGIARSYYLDINGNDITKTFMKESDFCIGESLFENGNSIQGFEALENIQAVKFNAKQLKEILLSNEELTHIYIDYLEKNLIYKMNRESSFQLMSATERYINFHKQYKDIENRVNQSYIASYLGIVPESLSRIKKH